MNQHYLHDSPEVKTLTSPNYNFVFRKRDGFFARWGRKLLDDPDYSPFGPEIADIEISTVCHGVAGPCRFCYKQNGPVGHNMSLAIFKTIFSKFPNTLTQIAFGIGDIDGNPDMWNIFQHCRDHGVVPNVTINGARMTPEHYQRLTKLCGAVAVSRYDDDACFNAVKALTDAGLHVNIHQIISKETYKDAERVIRAASRDPRLKNLNAVVLLAVKPVGRGDCLEPLRDPVRYKALVTLAFDLGVGVGFDSCSAPLFLRAVQQSPQYRTYETLMEPCESWLFSIYVDHTGRTFPCSFVAEGEGIDLASVQDFDTEVWRHPDVVAWRTRLHATTHGGLVQGCRQCPVFAIY